MILPNPKDWFSPYWMKPESEVCFDLTNWLRLEVGSALVNGSL